MKDKSPSRQKTEVLHLASVFMEHFHEGSEKKPSWISWKKICLKWISTINDRGPPKTCLTLHSPVSKYQHDPSIQLGQSFRNEFFSSFRENSTDEPQIKWIGCQGKYIGIWSCPILEWQTRTSTSTGSFFFVGHTVKTACLIMINKQASINIARKVIEIVTVSLSPQFSLSISK